MRAEPRTTVRTHVSRHTVEIETAERVEIVDLTDRVAAMVGASGVHTGLAAVHSRHTTASVVINENEPLLLDDLRGALERWAPRGAGYRHDDLAARADSVPPWERPNADSHLRALLLGGSTCMSIESGELSLGDWQRLLLIELDGPRRRRISVTLLGSVGEPDPTMHLVPGDVSEGTR